MGRDGFRQRTDNHRSRDPPPGGRGPRHRRTEMRKSTLLFVMSLATSAGLAVTPPVHDVKNYGAVGDGTTPATAAIQKAVDACAAEGGGRVVIPPGRYVTGPIFLRSRVQIDFESGAVLLGS